MQDQVFLEAKAHLAAIIESSDDAIISKDLNGIVRSWNRSAQRIFGYEASEIIGQHISLLIPKERLDEEYVILGKIRAGESIVNFETVRVAKSGIEVHISLTVSPILDANGQVVGASKIARDISQLKLADRASAYLAAIVESSDDVIISKNLDGTITSWNGSAERIFGYTAEEMIGRHISVLIPEENLDEEYAIIGRIKAGERVEHFETVRRTKNGNLVNLSLTVSPILDKNGTVIGASKVARDITEQKRLADLMQDAARRKDEFIANISHELRTPMNAIIGLSNILWSSSTLSEENKKYISTLKQSADDLMVLINNMLDFSKMENGSLEFEEREFDITQIVDKVSELMQVPAKEKSLSLKVSYAPPMVRFFIGDAFRIQQVLTNLVSNAVKFTAKGSVEIRVSSQEIDSDMLSVLFEVTDTGIGIPEDKLILIFDKFTQADASTTRKYGGSGLGLALAKSFVEAMGGTIKVKSRTGLGSTFSFVVPLKRSKQDESLLETRHTAEVYKKNVLIVEDYQPNILVISVLLERFGYNYDIAYNGAEAIQRYRDGTYDVILMDVQMDEMDGLESAARIRSLEQEKERARTPIIAMTAHVQESDKNKCLEAGMDDFLAKPFDLETLQKKLSKLIPKA